MGEALVEKSSWLKAAKSNFQKLHNGTSCSGMVRQFRKLCALLGTGMLFSVQLSIPAKNFALSSSLKTIGLLSR
jgi:hypothetical protein